MPSQIDQGSACLAPRERFLPVLLEVVGSRLRKHAFWLLVAAAMLLAVGLRSPWFGAPLGNDEGGLAYIGANSHGGGPYLYGHYFLDRPPLLLGIFHFATETGGTAGVRTVGAASAALLVVIVALIALELGDRKAALWSAVIAAALASSPALTSVFTPAELLAVVPSAGSVLLLLVGYRRNLLGCFAIAGFLAIAALLVKQSFGDALLAGVMCLGAGAYTEPAARRRWLSRGAAYLGGIFGALLCLELWELLHGAPDGAVSYALAGFRLDGLGALAGSGGGLLGRFGERLAIPVLASGLVLVWGWSFAGFRGLRGRPVLVAVVAAWTVGGLAGVLLGGSYWAHYLIELIPVSSVTAALALAGAPPRRIRAVIVTAFVTLMVANVAVGPSITRATSSDDEASVVGAYVGDRARAKDSAYVIYSQPNVTYYSGLRDPYPYLWSLMLRIFPDSESRLRSLLRSDHRPTWIVAWESTSAFGLDERGVTQDLLRRHYRSVGDVCGVPILLELGERRPQSGATGACE